MVASGATGGLHAAVMALLNPKDDVLLFEPFYGYHAVTLQSMRVNPILVPLAEPDWSLDSGCAEGCGHAAHARHSAEYACQPERQDLQSRRA